MKAQSVSLANDHVLCLLGYIHREYFILKRFYFHLSEQVIC